jgi:hypothetical protein
MRVGNVLAASQSSEIIGTITTGQVASVLCLKPSSTTPPDATCLTNSTSDPSGNDFYWAKGSVVSGTTYLAVPQAAPLLIDPTENFTIAMLPGNSGPQAWAIQSVSVQLQDSMGVLSPQTVVLVSAPWTGAGNCIARLAGLPNSSAVSFAWANMSSDDALTQSPGGIFLNGERGARSSACAP